MGVTEVYACNGIFLILNRKLSINNSLNFRTLYISCLQCSRNSFRIKLRVSHIYFNCICFSCKFINLEFLDTGSCLESNICSCLIFVVTVCNSCNVIVIQILSHTTSCITCHLTFWSILIKESHACISLVSLSNKNKWVSTNSITTITKTNCKSAWIINVLLTCINNDEVISSCRHFCKLDCLLWLTKIININKLNIFCSKLWHKTISNCICRINCS